MKIFEMENIDIDTKINLLKAGSELLCYELASGLPDDFACQLISLLKESELRQDETLKEN